MVFSSENQKFNLFIEDAFLEQINTHIKKAGRKETGGILIGNYSGDQSIAKIKKITGPPQDSKSSYSWFHRGMKGLQNLIDKSWDKNEYYIGEWHYHPFSAPNPSGQDIRQMKDIATSSTYNCPEPLLLIVGGSPNNIHPRAFVSLKDQQFLELFEVGRI